jgi:tetratricopeptide (TPR) repeat protein
MGSIVICGTPGPSVAHYGGGTMQTNEPKPVSILDGMPSAAKIKEVIEYAMPIAKNMIEAMGGGPKEQRILELMQQGMTLAEIYGLTQDDCDAIYARAHQLLQAGDVEKGRHLLSLLAQLDPFDMRVVYAFALIHQEEGNVSAAAKLYMRFLALDPTNVDAHLRIGECFLSAREYDNAIERFKFAREQCDLGKGSPEAAAHADKMLAHIDARLAEMGAA